MFRQLVNHNEDIKRLVEKGYAVGFDSNCIVIRDIPYLDSEKQLRTGAIVSKLEFIDDVRVKQIDHQVFFCGSHPHDKNGKPIPNLGGDVIQMPLKSKDIIIQRSFSNKPVGRNGFDDHFEKIQSYVHIISGPAINMYGANPLTYNVTEEDTTESVFKFADTLTSRAELSDLAALFKDDVIAIIGLGGTGSYILDFLVKTPVKEIRGYDLDPYHVHNAFRSPGKMDQSELGKSKSEIYHERYQNFRTGFSAKAQFIDASSVDELSGVTFAFVCVDKGSSRSGIFDLLINLQIPFIDVGMGLNKSKGSIDGMARVTYYSKENAADMRGKGFAQMEDDPDDIYRNNIQISELNALNASMAVFKYKQIKGFYFDESNYHHMVFGINDSSIVGRN